MLSGSSHLVGCRLSGCCRRSLREKCQSRTSSEKVCGLAWHRRNSIKLFRTPTIDRALASWLHFTLGFQGFWLERRQTFLSHRPESSSTTNCLPCQSQAIRIFQSSARRIRPRIVQPHDLKTSITCVLEDPHYKLGPSPCSRYSYIGIVPVRTLTRGL